MSTLMTTEERPRRQINITSQLVRPNEYNLALNGELAHRAFDEVRVLQNKSKWREQIFKVSAQVPMDLEIGTGNGLHFAHHAAKYPDRLIVGVELKYKPLVQSIRRALLLNCTNAAITRFHAFNIDQIFAAGEIDNVYIHFPDPWTSPRKPKNRFMSKENLDLLYDLQKPGSFVDLKTDSREYHLWAMEEIKQSKYKIVFETQNLHHSEMAAENFKTQFEGIFLRKGIEINFVRLVRD